MKKENKKTSIYSYSVNMTIHIIADTKEEANKKLDEQGGIVTKKRSRIIRYTNIIRTGGKLNGSLCKSRKWHSYTSHRCR